MKKINILGVEYTIEEQSEVENPKLEQCSGLCELYSKRIILNNLKKDKDDVMCVENLDEYKRQVVRHEIFHAFFGESGLRENSYYAENEELIDWLAIQSPKIFKVFQELDVI